MHAFNWFLRSYQAEQIDYSSGGSGVIHIQLIRRILSSSFYRLGCVCITLSKRIGHRGNSDHETSTENGPRPAHLIRHGPERSLYETPEGIRLWLSESSIIDDAIIREGVWERTSTELIKEIVQPGSIVLDVGANMGYYTSLISKLIGPTGRVHAFEPTKFFGKVLARNVAENNCVNVSIHDFGLSDRERDSNIYIDGSTASLHMDTDGVDMAMEVAHFVPLDLIVDSLQLDRLDFIKIDVDGHEPKFLRGSEAVLQRFHPKILLEINHLDYLRAGTTAWDFYDYVRSLSMHIHNVDTRMEITSKTDFLKQCGNFAYQVRTDVAFSRNILLTHSECQV